MRRRQLFFAGLAGAGALACGGKTDDPMAETSIQPWHLWGGSSQAQLNGVALVSSEVRSQQLARINYNRPDTWQFLFAVNFLDITAPNPVVVGVDFRVVVGLGRNTTTLDPFLRFEFAPGALTPATPIQRFATVAQAELPSATIFPAVAPNLIEHFPAQSIQCDARVFSEGSLNAGNVARFELAAYFAPRTHVRPDWFQGHFTGGELKGK